MIGNFTFVYIAKRVALLMAVRRRKSSGVLSLSFEYTLWIIIFSF